MSNFKLIYKEKVLPDLKKLFVLKSDLEVPKIEKVVVNAGVGRTLKDQKLLELIIEDLRRITGQAPVKTLAKKAIAGFKIRENQVVGLMVTLRGKRMYDFLEKLVNVALPRVRDFKGLSRKSFDGKGNYNIGIREQIVFPEALREGADQTFSLEVNIRTNAGDDAKAFALLKSFGFPFQNEEGK
ncbi:MAG: 50S ribosomal protein L5 [Candidatus Doudnabacteria bacterium]|nr:50S ribosomal protein L5 [Candidatus Doudnabacteria bacterium]